MKPLKILWLALCVLFTGCTLYRSGGGDVLIRAGLDTSAEEITFRASSATQPAHCTIKNLKSVIDPAVADALYAAGVVAGRAQALVPLAAMRPSAESEVGNRQGGGKLEIEEWPK